MPFWRICKRKKEQPLQVSKEPLPENGNRCTRPEKRAALSLARHFSGSMAAEAAMVLWLFIVFAVSLMMPMEFVQVQLRVQKALEEQLRIVCSQAAETEQNVKRRWEWLARSCVKGKEDGVLINCVQDGDRVELDAAYCVTIPFSMFGKREFFLQNSCSGRVWSGSSEQDAWNGKDGSLLVYVTPYGTAFHWYRDCVNLDVAVSETKADSLNTIRNASGGRYYPCRYCADGKQLNGDGAVFITRYGQRYHVDSGCSRLNRTVTAIVRKDAGSRHLCGKCGKRREEEP